VTARQVWARWPAALLLVVLFAATGGSMFSDLTWRKRKYERDLREYVEDSSRYVDIGVVLCVVVHDPHGQELVPDAPRLRVVRRHYAGGIVDTRRPRRGIIAASQRRQVWYCSEEQERIILHSDEEPLGQLVYGSEGGGKTETLPMWHFFRWLEHLGQRREGGQTAPTKARLEVFLEKFRERIPPTWFKYYSSKNLIRFCDGTKIRLVSTHKPSSAGGSPIQGYGWSWCGMDEAQDSTDRWDDVDSRGRVARKRIHEGVERAWYKQARTCTAKDTGPWRAAKDKVLASGLWIKRTLLGLASPFIPRSFWADKAKTMSRREYERRVLAQDVGVELAVYYSWDRRLNLAARPRIATDVTAAVLVDYPSYACPGARFTIGCGHDPGNIFNTTVIYRMIMVEDVPTWFVVGEFQTKQTTARQHARGLRAHLEKYFGVERRLPNGQPDPDSDKAAIFVDPHGKGEADTDYQTVYMAFQKEGLDVFAPAKKIKRAARVAMVNRLLCDATDTHRLKIACDAGGELGPAFEVQGAPGKSALVDAFETLEKKAGDDNPEGSQRKDVDDKTHAPAALGYGLWVFEQESTTTETFRRAVAAARRHG
jgi:hypothetical protein